MQFCTTFKLSYTAIGALLTLLIFLCPGPNLIPPTFYRLKKFFERQTPIHSRRKICLSCNTVKEECTCQNLQSPTADLVHLNIRKSMETVLSSDFEPFKCLNCFTTTHAWHQICRQFNYLYYHDTGNSDSLCGLQLSNEKDDLCDIWDGAALRKECE